MYILEAQSYTCGGHLLLWIPRLCLLVSCLELISLNANDIELDLGNGKVIFKGKGGGEQFVINSAFIGDDSIHRFEWEIYCGLATVNQESDCDTEMGDESMNEEFVVPKYMVSNQESINVQKRNYAINKLRSKIEKQLAPKDWNIKALNQFKKSAA